MSATAGTLTLIVDSSSVSDGERALDSIARTGARVEGSLKIDMGSIEKAMARLGQQVTSLDSTMTAGMGRVTAAGHAQAKTFDQLRASIDPAFAAAQRYQEVQQQLSAMVSSGEASQRAANLVLEQAASRYMGVATAAERAAEAERKAALSTASAKQNYEHLRASLDPLYAASKKFEAALETVNTAQKAGVISDKDRARTLDLLEAQMIQADTASLRAAGGVGKFGLVANQVGYQVQDVFVSAPMVGWFRAIAQQAPQAAGAFSMLGGSIGTFLPWVGTAIAVGAALAPTFLSGADGAREFDNALGDLTDAVSDYRRYVDLANAITVDLEGKFGSSAEKASKLAQFMAEFGRVEAVEKLDAAVSSLTETFGGLSRVNFTVEVNRPVVEILATMNRLKSELGITEEQAKAVVLSLERLANADTPQETIAAAVAMNEAFRDVFGSLDMIPKPLMEAAKQAGLIAFQAGEIVDPAEQARLEAERQSKAAAEIVSKYERQAEMAIAIATFGKDSAQVEALKRAEAIRTAQALVDQAGLSGDVAQNVLNAANAAFDAEANSARAAAALRDAEAAANGLARAMATAAGFSASLEGQIAVLDAQIQAATNKQNVAIVGQIKSLQLQAEAHRVAQIEAANGSISALDAADAEYEAQLRLIDTLADKRVVLDGVTQSTKKAAKAGARAAKETERQLDAIRASIDPFHSYNKKMKELVALKGHLSDDEMAMAIKNLNMELADSLPLVGELSDAIAGAIVAGDSLSDAFANVLRQMAQDALSSGIKAILTDQLTPGTGGGGFFGTILGGLLGKTGATEAEAVTQMAGSTKKTDWFNPPLIANSTDIPKSFKPQTVNNTSSNQTVLTVVVDVTGANGDEAVKKIAEEATRKGIEQAAPKLIGQSVDATYERSAEYPLGKRRK